MFAFFDKFIDNLFLFSIDPDKMPVEVDKSSSKIRQLNIIDMEFWSAQIFILLIVQGNSKLKLTMEQWTYHSFMYLFTYF